jgi:CheY-like chemotaxis protein
LGEPKSPVLIIDDDDDARALVRETLESAGHPVLEAANGLLALELLVGDRRRTPSLMLVDLTMPIMTGIELITVVRSYIHLARIPAIVLSSLPPGGAVLQERFVSAWLQKPVAPRALLEIVSSILARGDRAA